MVSQGLRSLGQSAFCFPSFTTFTYCFVNIFFVFSCKRENWKQWWYFILYCFLDFKKVPQTLQAKLELWALTFFPSFIVFFFIPFLPPDLCISCAYAQVSAQMPTFSLPGGSVLTILLPSFSSIVSLKSTFGSFFLTFFKCIYYLFSCTGMATLWHNSAVYLAQWIVSSFLHSSWQHRAGSQ